MSAMIYSMENGVKMAYQIDIEGRMYKTHRVIVQAGKPNRVECKNAKGEWIKMSNAGNQKIIDMVKAAMKE